MASANVDGAPPPLPASAARRRVVDLGTPPPLDLAKPVVHGDCGIVCAPHD